MVWHVVFPVARPAMAVLGMLTFVMAWNDFFWPVIALTQNGSPTVQVALTGLGRGYIPDQSVIMAGALLGTLPFFSSSSSSAARSWAASCREPSKDDSGTVLRRPGQWARKSARWSSTQASKDRAGWPVSCSTPSDMATGRPSWAAQWSSSASA